MRVAPWLVISAGPEDDRFPARSQIEFHPSVLGSSRQHALPCRQSTSPITVLLRQQPSAEKCAILDKQTYFSAYTPCAEPLEGYVNSC